MHEAIRARENFSEDQELFSEMAGLECPPGEDMARQEFAKEADINTILSKFGVDSFTNRRPQFVATDWSLDLQTALDATAATNRAFKDLPDDVKKDFPTPEAMLNGIVTGVLKFRDQPEIQTDEKPPKPVPS